MDVILNVVLLRRRLTGIGQYTLRLAEGLKCHPSVPASTTFTGSGSGFPSPPPGSRGGASAVRGICFRAQSALKGPAVYHEPNYLLLSYSGPTVATIHDLSWAHFG